MKKGKRRIERKSSYYSCLSPYCFDYPFITTIVRSNLSLVVTNFLNITPGHCEATDEDFCIYDINLQKIDGNELMYCDVVIKES